jgi:hypothetical protein
VPEPPHGDSLYVAKPASRPSEPEPTRPAHRSATAGGDRASVDGWPLGEHGRVAYEPRRTYRTRGPFRSRLGPCTSRAIGETGAPNDRSFVGGRPDPSSMRRLPIHDDPLHLMTASPSASARHTTHDSLRTTPLLVVSLAALLLVGCGEPGSERGSGARAKEITERRAAQPSLHRRRTSQPTARPSRAPRSRPLGLGPTAPSGSSCTIRKPPASCTRTCCTSGTTCPT